MIFKYKSCEIKIKWYKGHGRFLLYTCLLSLKENCALNYGNVRLCGGTNQKGICAGYLGIVRCNLSYQLY